MATATAISLADAVRAAAFPLTGDYRDFDPLLAQIGDARLVLLGEASHGTHEFYSARARITKRLIVEKGFDAVAIEADWPDALRVHRYVQCTSDDQDAEEALGGFRRFPAWMWRNADVLDFVGWLQAYNETLPEFATKVGFFGLDLYSLYNSIREVIRFLERHDPEAGRRARYRYSCLDHFGEDAETYGYSAAFDLRTECEDQVVAELTELQAKSAEHIRRNGDHHELFYAEQNARVVKNAEHYYRAMFGHRAASWNLRDRHMAETLDALVRHLDARGRPVKLVVWAHNSHLGDARATDMVDDGELNLGQLVRERYGEASMLIGFSTYQGTVIAARHWGQMPERKRVRPALRGSYEALFHDTGLPRFLLPLRDLHADLAAMRERRLQRAIGVVYRPESERTSHYLHANLPAQFDAILHFDRTRAVEPLERHAERHGGDAPETFPSTL